MCPSNVYIDSLILPSSQCSPSGCSRAFSATGRLAPVAGREWSGGYSFRPFEIETTKDEFVFSKRSVSARADKSTASNLAVAWTKGGLEEATLGGVLRGRKAFDPKGAGFASRQKMWALALEVAGILGVEATEVQKMLKVSTYRELKGSSLLQTRRRVKEDVTSEALEGWIKNTGDESFCLA